VLNVRIENCLLRVIIEILVKCSVFITVLNPSVMSINSVICYNTIFPPLSRLADWSHSFRFHHQIPVFISLLPLCAMCLANLTRLSFIILRVSNYLQIQTAIQAMETA
jgi:hypothetical protein